MTFIIYTILKVKNIKRHLVYNTDMKCMKIDHYLLCQPSRLLLVRSNPSKTLKVWEKISKLGLFTTFYGTKLRFILLTYRKRSTFHVQTLVHWSHCGRSKYSVKKMRVKWIKIKVKWIKIKVKWIKMKGKLINMRGKLIKKKGKMH